MIKRALISAIILGFIPLSGFATNGVWNYNGGDNWTTAGRWVNNQIAGGIDGVADFSQVDIGTATRTNSLNGNRTIGTIFFGDFMWLSNDWALQRNPSGILSLDVTSGMPAINIVNRTTTITAVIDGTKGLEKKGPGTLILEATNTFTGPVVLSGGQMTLNFRGTLSPTSDIINAGSTLIMTNGAILRMQGSDAIVNHQTFNGLRLDDGLNFLNLTNGSGGTIRLNLGTITRNTGIVDFNAPTNCYITTTTPNMEGILGCYATIYTNDWAANNGANTIVVYTAYATNMFLPGFNTIIATNVTMTNATVNSLRFNNAAGLTLTLSGTNIVSAGGIMFTTNTPNGTKINSGWLTSGTNELIIIDNHRVDRRTAAVNTNLDTVITDRGTTSVAVRVASYTSVLGSQNGSLVTFARTNNTYTGGTHLYGGGLYFQGDGSLGPVPASPQTNIVAVSGFNWFKPRSALTTDVNRIIHINTNAFLVLDGGNAFSINGEITGSGVLLGPPPTYLGGVVTLNGSNTMTGTIEADNIGLRMTNAFSLPATANLRLAGVDTSWDHGIVELNGTFTRDLGFGPNQVAWFSTIYNSAWRSGGFAAVGGPLTVNIGGSGSNLVWGQNYFSVNQYLQLGSYNSTHPVTWINPINFNAVNGGRRINIRGTAIIQGVISGTECEMIKSAPGTLILTATNSYGITRIEQGIITINCDANLGAVPLATNNNIRFNYGNAVLQAGADLVLGITRNIWIANTYIGTLNSSNYVMTVSGVINGQGGLGKDGSGQVVLLNENTYVGPTLISNGTLVVNGSLYIDSFVTATNTGFLGGTGVVNGPVTILSGSGLMPGGTNNGGTLTLKNTLNMNPGSVYGWRYDSTPGSVAVSNQVTFSSGGTYTLRLYNPNGLAEPVGQQFVIMTWPNSVSDPDTNIIWNIEKPAGGGAEGWAMPQVTMDTLNNQVLITFPVAGFPAVDNGIGPSSVLTNTAVLNGNYSSTGSTAQVYIYWGTSDGGTNKASWQWIYTNGLTSYGAFSNAVTDLYYGFRYYYRSYASNAVGECWSPVSSSFAMLPAGVYANGLRGSLFLNNSGDSASLILTDAAYVMSYSRVFTGYKVNSVLALAEAPQYNTIATGDIYNFSMFPGFPSSDYFATAFSGQMVPRFSGVHNFRWDCDDWGMIYIDFNNDGIFQTSDGVVAAPIRASSGNVTLTAGQTYNVIFLGKENAGAESINFWITEPGQPEARVSVTLQPGMWRYCQAGAGVSNSLPSSIGATSAVFNAVLSSSGAVSEVWAYWGPVDCTNYASVWASSAYIGTFTNVTTNLSYTATGLTPDLQYYVRFSATNVLTTTWSDVRSFRTAYVPSVEAGLASPYRTKYVFSGYNKGETLTNFPALVVLSEGMTNFYYSQFSSSSGADLRFTDEAQTNELSYEIEQWDFGNSFSITSGLALWLKADAGVMTNTSGNVTNWLDQSGWGRDMTNIVSDPAVITNKLGGKPVVNFDGNDTMYTSYNFDSLQQYTVFSVARYTGPDMYSRVISSAAGRNWIFGFHSNGDERWHYDAWVYNAGTANTNWHLHTGTVNNDSDPKANCWKEGNQLAFNATGSSDNYFKPGRVELGGYNAGSTLYELSKCEIAELLIYDHVLTSNELNQVGAYLSQKYGLTTLYLPPTGKSYAWVKVPQFTNNCAIWAYWGNTNAAVAPAYTTNGSVWSEGYLGVWHMNRTNVIDSSSNHYNAAVWNSTVISTGLLGLAQNFYGTNTSSYVGLGTIRVASDISVEAWAYSTNFNQSGFILGKNPVNSRWQLFFEGSSLKWRATGGDVTVSGPSNDKWHYLAAAQSGSDANLYVDGLLGSSGTIGAIADGVGSVDIGRYNGGYYFNGMLDEIRLSSVMRSSNWLWASWLNQASNNIFSICQPAVGIRNSDATNITSTSAVLNATLYTTGLVTDVVAYWGTSDGGTNPAAWASSNLVGSFSELSTNISCTVTSLLSGIDYCFTFHAVSVENGLWASGSKNFRTLAGLSGFSNKMKITFSGYDRAETLTNFPAMVTFSENLPSFLYSQFQTGATDLRFLNEGETSELNYEIDLWNTNGSSYVWVQVPTFTSNCSIWAYWSNPSATVAPACTTNSTTWDSNYRGVWHMRESNVVDSTWLKNNGTGNGNRNTTDGRIGDAQSFSNNFIQISNENNFDLNEKLTVSVWVRVDNDWRTVYQAFVSKNGEGNGWALRRNNNNNYASFNLRGTTAADDSVGVTSLNDGKWHYLFGVYDFTQRVFYVDGARDTNFVDTGFIGLDNDPVRIGSENITGYAHKGLIDEVRIENAVRSSNWMWACWLNQASNSFFNTYSAMGGIQNVSASGITTTSAVLNATLNASNTAFDVSVYWGTNNCGTNIALWANTNYVGSWTNVASTNISCLVTGLASDVRYYYRFSATNAVNSFLAVDVLDFKTIFSPGLLSTYPYRMQIAFSGYTPTNEILTNFPALVVLNQGTNGFLYNQLKPTGTDLRFTDESTNELNYEIESWNTNGSSYVWVQVPQLTNNCSIWAYWGNTNAPVPAYLTSGATLDSNFKGVWHLGESTIPVTDWTANFNDGATVGVGVNYAQVGQIDKCAEMTQTGWNGGIRVPDDNSSDFGSSSFTVETWVRKKQTSVGWNNCVAYNKWWNGGNPGLNEWSVSLSTAGSDDKPCFVIEIGNTSYGCSSPMPIALNTWNHIVGIRSGTTQFLYINGNLMATSNGIPAGAINNVTRDLYMGYWVQSPTLSPKVLLDECRASSVARSSNWIWACYMNQSSNSVFNPAGGVEGIFVPSVNNGNGASSVMLNSANLNGYLVTTGGASTAVSVYWGTTDGGMNKSAWANTNDFVVTGAGPLTTNIAGLASGTEYYYRFYASNSFGECWAPSTTNFSLSRYRMKVQFSGYDKAETLTNFPALVTFADGSNGFSYAQCTSTNGGDLRFVNSNETVSLNYEIEKWNPSGSSYVWVQVPELVSNGWVWAYWGGSDTNAPTYTTNGATWSQDYLSVWHFNSTNISSKYPDSTAYRFDGVNYGANTIQGQIAGAVDIGLAPRYIDVGGIGCTSSNYTFHCWIKTTTRADGYFIDIGSGRLITEVTGGGALRYYDSSLNWRVAGTNVNNGQWHNAVFVLNGITPAGAIYLDGVVGSGMAYQPTKIGGNARIGCDNGNATVTPPHLDGMLDEFQISTVLRSSNWIWACYMNQGSNGLFNTISPAETTTLPVIGNSGSTNSVTMSSAYIDGYLSSTGGAPTDVSVYWGATDGGTNKLSWANPINFGVTNAGPLSTNVTGLSYGTTYYYRYYASNSFGECWAPSSTAFSPHKYQMQVRFSGYNKDETLTNFPALVVFSEGTNGFSYSQMTSLTGGDLRFMNSNETVALNYEIEQWDPYSDSNPTNITGLALWLKADAGVQTNESGNVTSWTDQSGADVVASQGTTANQPLYVTNVINGIPAVRFDGTNDQMTWSALPAQTIFVVNRVAVGAKTYAGLIGLNGNNVGIRRANSTTWNHSGSWDYTGNYGDFSYPLDSAFRINGYGTTTVAEDTWHIVAAIRGGGTFNVDSIGSYYGAREFSGDYAEVIVYNRVLTQSEQNRVGWYLAQKYGLNTYYTQPVGQSYVWVQVPELIANGYIWAYWGGLDTNPPACTMNGSTWDANYKGVWHMSQPNAKDSTANANNGAASSVYVVDSPGAIGLAQGFGGNGQISMSVISNSSLDISGNKLTQSAWIKPAANVNYGTIATRNSSYYFQREGTIAGQIGKVAAYQYGTTPEGYHYSTGTVPLYAWSYVAYSYDGANIKFYINGVEAGTNITKTGNVRRTGSYFQIGGENGARLWNGLLDEVRVSDIPRSSNWMWACYMNQASNAAFMSPSFFISNEGATNIAADSADLLGYLHEDDDIATYGWVYYGLTDAGSVAANWQFTNSMGSLTEGLLSSHVTSLQADKTYYYRYYASNAVRFAWTAPSAQFFTGEVIIHATDSSASEIGPDTGMFTVYRLTSATNEPLTVNYIIGGTAVNGVDYQALGGSVVIPAGETNATITVTPIEEVLVEPDETVTATLIFGSYAIGLQSNAVVTIHDAASSLWPYKMKVMFPGYINPASEILTNFPAMVTFGTNIPTFSYSTFALPASGGDLRFGNSNETMMLNYEIEKWDSSTNSYVWVQIPELVDSNTYIWAYWGNKSVTNAPAYTTNGSTWSQGFAGVWHMTESAFPYVDSSANRFNGTGGTAPSQSSNGIIGNGQAFDGISQSIQIPYYAALNTTQFTISCWVKVNTYVTNLWQTPLFTRNSNRGYNFYAGSNGLWQAWVGNNVGGFSSISAGPIIDGEWIYLAMNFNNEFTQAFYTNGVFVNNAVVPTFSVNTIDTLKMGQGANYLNGEMDEVRVENMARSSNWVWSCWINQASNNMFNAYGNIRKFGKGTVIVVR